MLGYTTANLIFKGSEKVVSANGDWSQVSRLTGVSLYWYCLGGLLGGIAANEYRYYWHKKAFPDEKSPNRFAIGFSTSY
jgi:hypothetical protein